MLATNARHPDPSWFRRQIIDNNIFWAIVPNIVIGFFLLFLAQCQIEHAAVRAERIAMEAVLLKATSQAVVDVETYPPENATEVFRATPSFIRDVKEFEAAYWGQPSLVLPIQAQKCLTRIHLILIGAIRGGTSSLNADTTAKRLQLALQTVVYAIEITENPHDAKDSAGYDGRLLSDPKVCDG